ncbi:SMI1/KNR4 family protein [Paenibacillus lutrae]|uniref:Knr4/Smi1-like domain-containing protein n=1 Tax=Paenibacillus lutrae TaxID=2078573 RepID=A0A7X3FDS6_9BACL|nr:SMI1/KNR4 family protein [Paenibacillus lutrae]MVO97943.1 hypothetical protein [Paenibacillus lutrae]
MASVDKTITGLKELYKDTHRLIQSSDGYLYNTKCVFNEPATIQQITSLCNEKKWTLPEDYKQFLLITNGAKIFYDEYYGMSWEFFNINDLLTLPYLQFPDHLVPIAFHIGDFLVIDTNKVDEGNYLSFQDHEESLSSPSVLFNYGFDVWLDRLVVCQGTKFWEWK